MKIPSSINKYFQEIHFEKYPLIDIPQSFLDERGEILNIADGEIGDVAIISTKPNSIRANHSHNEDWHLSYLINGEIEYFWEDETEQKSIVIKPGQLFYTPPKVPHKMLFLKASTFIAIAAMSRTKENYEKDTTRLNVNYFE